MPDKSRACVVALATALLTVQLSSASDSAQEHLGAGLKLFEVERYSEAIKELRLALESDSGLSEAQYYLAVSCFNERKYLEAREHFELLLHSGYQKDWVTYYLGRLDLAAGHLDSAIRRFESLKRPAPVTDELYYLGSALMKGGKAAQAAVVLERQIRFNPRDFRAHSLLRANKNSLFAGIIWRPDMLIRPGLNADQLCRLMILTGWWRWACYLVSFAVTGMRSRPFVRP